MKNLSLNEMEYVSGGRWQDCVTFGVGAVTAFFGGPLGVVVGVGTMVASAGDCESSLF